MDIAPTLLNLLGVKGPDDMDGRVLSEIFTPQYEAQAADAGSAELVGSTASSTYSDEDEAIIAERLKALGYIE